MTDRIQIRITADDLGWSEAVDQGIAQAAARGALSAVSVLATGPSFAHGVDAIRRFEELSIGLHLDLTDFTPAANPGAIPSLVGDRGRFRRRSRRLVIALALGAVRVEDVAREAAAQMARLHAAGINPSHIDGHRHAHVFPRVASVSAALARQYRLGYARVVSRHSPRGVMARARPERMVLERLSRTLERKLASGTTLCAESLAGLAEGRALEPDWVAHAILGARPGLTEIVTHPGVVNGEAGGRGAGHSRAVDLEALLGDQPFAALAARGAVLWRP